MWLFQEGEQVSSDRLFRVRKKQPFAEHCSPQAHTCSTSSPVVCKTIQIGNICAFNDAGKWFIGRILQFCYYKEKTKRAQQFSGHFVDLSGKIDKIGVLCSWYTPSVRT